MSVMFSMLEKLAQ